MSDLDAIFKAYDVRGTYPDQIDAPGCHAIGAAFARFALQEGGPVAEILVARDMRPSGVELAEAFSDGVRSQGVPVVDIGLPPPHPRCFAAGSRNAPGAMFTASHNPAQYNGIKFCLAGAKPVGQDTGLAQIQALAAEGVPVDGSRPAGKVRSQDLLDDFAEHVLSFVDLSVMKPLKVVADTA